MMGVMALLIGLFAVPLFLLWAGHHWRHRSARLRGAFWGGLIAHTIAALFATIAALVRPAEWAADDTWRGFFGLWSMLAFFVVGAVIGAVVKTRSEAKATRTERAPARAPARPPAVQPVGPDE